MFKMQTHKEELPSLETLPYKTLSWETGHPEMLFLYFLDEEVGLAKYTFA